ncbi:CARDB domain-containing protein [uncultured Cellulomonas sp.]|uniref:CARDB domain-containing protein n=1 Tax=uncultured Cellulomonas sp. TaxID=189682 RepID=UPI0028F010C1|nr:CARDB domain-containing protein [uncultured Cellulomonas sp.]
MRTRLKRAIVAGAAIALVAPLGVTLVAQGASAAPVLLSAGKPATASSTNQSYVAGNVTDGNQATYWESSSAFPQWVQVDLGAAATVTDVTLRIPGGWGARSETVTLQGSTDGSGFSTLKASAPYTFTGGNIVAVDVTDTSVRYVRASVSANTGWPAAQLSEVEVYGTSSTPPVDPPAGTNLAQGRPITGSSVQQTYVATNAVDGSTGTYWEGAPGAYPSNLTVSLAAPSALTGVVVTLNPDPAWGNRTQTFAIEGRVGGTWSPLKASASYAFSPSSGNTVTVPVSGDATDVRLVFTANTGSSNAQVAELQVFGTGTTVPTSPDLQVALTTDPITVTPTTAISVGATVRNSGTAAAPATTAVVALGGTSVGTATVPALAAGAQTTITVNAGTRPAGTYPVTVTVDPANTVAESVETNNTASGVVVATQPTGSDLAAGRPATASSTEFTFVAGNAVDADASTYWEGAGGQYPSWLAVNLASQSTLQRVVVGVPPAAAWGARTQTFSVEGRVGTGAWSPLKASAAYAFAPASGNTVTIPVTGSATDLRLVFTANTGAGNGQVSVLRVTGIPAPNPDLTVTAITASPAAPVETAAITLAATVRNGGNLASAATTVDLTVDGARVDSVAVPALAAGQSATVSKAIGTRPAGSYTIGAVVDPANTVVEQNDANNAFSNPTKFVVTEAPGPDLQVLAIASNPANPAVGSSVSFTATVKNRGSSAAAASTTRLVVGATTLNGATGALASGATATVALSGTWTATTGGATLTATADATNAVAETNEANNTLAQSIVVGRGAAVPYTSYEAEAGTYTGTLVEADALRTFGHTNFGTESSGRKSVRLTAQGQYVQLTSTNATNSIVIRSSIPDAAGGGGQEATISLYANGTFVQKVTLSSRHSWLYGTTDQPEGLTNTPGGDARRLFDESHALLPQSYPAGTVFRLQRDAGDTAAFYVVDLIDLEQVAPALPKPAECTSITAYGAVPNDGVDDTTAIQAAVTADQNGQISCVWIPEGQWRQEKKILTDDPLNRGTYNQVGISDVTIRGAGMWRSQLYSLIEPQDANTLNHPHEGNFGFDIDRNTQISDLAIFGSGRIRGGDGNDEGGVGLNGRFGAGTRISNVWIEHANVGAWVGRDYDNLPELWGPADGLEFTGMRIRNTYADGINFSNGTRNSRVFNSSFRTTGDDALAIWANPYVKDRNLDNARDNHFVNNTVQLPWRANGIAIYGGSNQSIENNLVYDTMNYPGIMLATDHSPLPFGGTTLIANNGLYRTGGAFWNEDQEFGAITLFPQTLPIPGVTIRDTDIDDSTYDGIQFKNGGGAMPDVRITNVRITSSRNGSGILAMSGVNGNAILSNVTFAGNAEGDVVREPGSQFVITGS